MMAPNAAAAIPLAIAAIAVTQSFELQAHMHSHRRQNMHRPLTSPSLPAPITPTRPLFKRRRRATFLLSSTKGDEAVGSNEIAQERRNNAPASKTASEELFQTRLAELGAFVSRHGHGSIPAPYPPNPSLGIWAANLRRQHCLRNRAIDRGAPYVGYLTPERIRQLRAAGFDFTSLTERQFQNRLGELREFRERYGHCLVPERWEENPALGAWVSNLRSLYKRRRRRGRLQRQLQDGEQMADSDDGRQRKEKRRARSKNVLLQSPSRPRPKRQRSPRFSHLDEERIKLLEELGFVWSSVDRKWLEMLEWAKVYGVVNYHLSSGRLNDARGVYTTLLHDNYCAFVDNIQDQSVLCSFYPQEDILEVMHGATSPNCDNETQISFQPTHLDYRIPPNDTLHQPLRIWMINQRSNYNRQHHSIAQTGSNDTSIPNHVSLQSTMTPSRQRSLEEVHFPWSGRFRNRIEQDRYEAERAARIERQRERERRLERREREERERVERLTRSRETVVEMEMDVMALWDAGGDDEDDEDDWESLKVLAELRDALARLEGKTDEYQLQMIDACKNGIKPEGSLSGHSESSKRKLADFLAEPTQLDFGS